jgi:hypothetical protein
MNREQADIAGSLGGFAGELIDPGHPSYERACRMFNADIDRWPALIARCADEADIKAAVRHARDHGLPLSVRCSGHSLAGHSSVDGGLVIETTILKRIEVDPQRRRVRVGAGTTWAELDAATQRFGLAVTGARNSTTGVVGVTLGGGSGWLERKHGLSCDNLLAAELVTAEGKTIRADRRERPELLWALRGAGADLGVVTWIELALSPLASPLLGGQLLYPRERAGELLEFLRDFMPGAPHELGIGLSMTSAPDAPFVPDAVRSQPIVGLTVCYADDPDIGRGVLRPLLDAFPPVLQTVGPRSYVEMQQILDPHVPPGLRYAARALHLGALSDDAIEVLVDHARCAPSPPCELIVIPGGGALERIAPESSPLAHRDAAATIWVLAAWHDPLDSERNVAWACAGSIALDPFSVGINLNLTGDEPRERIQTAFAADGYDRLRAIKRTYDPDDLFGPNQSPLRNQAKPSETGAASR